MKLTAATLALFPNACLALVGNGWFFPNSPRGGLKDIVFPINMANATHKSGYYFAQQFNFENIPDVGYTGIQPRPNSNGRSRVHAAFSSFQNGTTTTDPRCSMGADSGPGVHCSVETDGDYSHTYNLLVENMSNTTWAGTLINTVTGKRTHIGSWTLPAGSGGILSAQEGFVEYYLWNGGKNHPCNTLPKTQATFYNPTTSTPGAGTGDIRKPYEYGDCVGKVDFSLTQVTAGWKVDVGF